METADVVIVGAGFAGAATAYHLAQHGSAKVLLIEHEPRSGEHASGRNASLTFQILEDPYEAGLALEGARFIENPPPSFATQPLLRRVGSLLLAEPEGVPRLEASRQTAAALGLACEMVSKSDAVRRVPALADAAFSTAFWNPHDGVVNIRALLDGYLNGSARRGVRVQLQRSLTGVQTTGGQIRRVDTSRGPVATDCLVNAAGAWAGIIADHAGVTGSILQARRRHMFVVQSQMEIAADAPFVWHNDIDVYFRREGAHLLISPCDAEKHAAISPEVDSASEILLRSKVARAFPSLSGFQVVRNWACLRTFAPDERFLIGRDPTIEGFVWVAALGGHGMTTSSAVGRLGSMAVRGDSSPQLDYFSPRKFIKRG